MSKLPRNVKPQTRPLSQGTLKKIIKQAEVTDEQLKDLK